MELITSILIILCIILAGLIAFIIYDKIRFPYTIVIREIGANRKIIYYDKGADYKEDGVKYLLLRRRRDILALPPSEAIEITRKGKKHLEVYYNPQDQSYTYLTDTSKPVNSFEPLTTNQRISLVNQTIKAIARKQKTMGELLLQYAPLGAVVIIIVSLFIFYGDIAKPVLQMGDTVAAYMEKAVKIADSQAQTAVIMQEILQNKQIIPLNEGEK